MDNNEIMLSKNDLRSIGELVDVKTRKALKEELKKFSKVVEKKIKDVLSEYHMGTLIPYFDEHVEKRFDGIDKKLVEHDRRFEEVSQKIEDNNRKIDDLKNGVRRVLESHEKRISNLEKQQTLS